MRSIGVQPIGKESDIEGLQPVAVADMGIVEKRSQSTILRHSHHQITSDRALATLLAYNDEDATRLNILQYHMKTEIVRHLAGDPERGTGNGRVVAERQNTAAEAALAEIGIANPADR